MRGHGFADSECLPLEVEDGAVGRVGFALPSPSTWIAKNVPYPSPQWISVLFRY